MLLTQEEVKKIAKLARIELTAAEVEKFQRELTAVLEYVSELNKVDTEGVEEISQVTGLQNVFRQDNAEDVELPEAGQMRGKILNNFPEEKDGFLKIKSIL